MHSEFIHVYSGSSDLLKMDRAAHAEALTTWLCGGCMHPRPNIEQIDAIVRSTTVTKFTINAIAECSVMVAHSSFVDTLGSAITNELEVGSIRDEDGQILDSIVTLYSPHEVIIRGSANVTFRSCHDCGRSIYYAAGERYLYPHPPGNRTVWTSDLSGLVLPKSIFSKLDLSGSKHNVLIERLNVISEPKDGFKEIHKYTQQSHPVDPPPSGH